MKKYKGVLVWPFMIAVKIVLVLAGLVVVPVGLKLDKLPRLFTSTRNIPTFWENAIRNPADGIQFWFQQPVMYALIGNNEDQDMEPHLITQKFAWQYRYFKWFSSIRLVWQYNDERYGELFVGFKLGMGSPNMDFAMQFRPWAEVGN